MVRYTSPNPQLKVITKNTQCLGFNKNETKNNQKQWFRHIFTRESRNLTENIVNSYKILLMILGENFFPLLLLAFGGALIVGPSLALINSKILKKGESENLDLKRVYLQILSGSILSIWAIGTLFN